MKKIITFLIVAFTTTLPIFSQTVETVSTGLTNPLGMALDGNAFNVYPNPVKDVLHIYSDKVIIGATVTNILGQTVITLPDSNQIDMSSLPVGSYLVKMLTEGGEKILKVFKQ